MGSLGAADYGFFGNDALSGGGAVALERIENIDASGVLTVQEATLEAVDCDFGTADDDNAPEDVLLQTTVVDCREVGCPATVTEVAADYGDDTSLP